MKLKRINHILVSLLAILFGVQMGLYLFAGDADTHGFRLGLDLKGGSYLVYSADVAGIDGEEEIRGRMDVLRDVIERRVNALGVSEPSVSVEIGSTGAGKDYRLIVELPGVEDTEEAIAVIGQTPLLEFKVENPDFDPEALNDAIDKINASGNLSDIGDLNKLSRYGETVLTGEYLKDAQVVFNSGSFNPIIQLNFDDEGAKIFETVTEENIGKTIAIFLDGQLMSAPVVQQKISGGEAVITGDFTPDEAKELVARLDSGALPIAIELVSSETVGPYLGREALDSGLRAGLYSFLAIGLFLILWYRLLGVVAVVALAIYSVVVLAIFKSLGITITTTGIAGLIISLGVAVDANILIFERVKEELKNGRTFYDAVSVGFSRAWSSIRDSNLSSIISVLILFWFGSSIVRGFAIAFGIGVVVSMLSAVVVSRYMLYAILPAKSNKFSRFLWGA